LYGLLAGFIAHPPSDGWWTVVPGVLYTTAALTDMADGYFARVRGETTRLGAKLDVEVDSLGILVATILAVQLGRIPTFFLALAGCYYLYQAGVSWRRSRGLPVYELPDSSWRRIVGGFQVGFLCVILWPVLPNSVTTLGGYVLAGPILFSFIRDWIAISRGPSSTPLTISSGLKPFFTKYLPVLLRIALVVSGIVFLTNAGAVVASLSLATFGIGILGLCSIALGAVGRFGALGWLVIGCAHAMQTGLTDLNSAIVAISLALMFLGTGAWSLWTPLDRLLMQPLGSAKQ
jgi:CDP-diacylglycerol--glycerol-3-phosphate 3-phosphatidyltransferase